MSLLLVVGFGPGNSRSIAHRFGREGWKVALVGRNPDRLDAGVTELGDAGIEPGPSSGRLRPGVHQGHGP